MSFALLHSNLSRGKGCHSRKSGNPEKHWIPPHHVRGRLSQARNDKQHRTHVVIHHSVYCSDRCGRHTGLSCFPLPYALCSLRHAILLPVLNSWIDQPVNQIGDQVQHHDDHRVKNHHRLKGRIIPLFNGTHHETPQSGPGKDNFCHD